MKTEISLTGMEFVAHVGCFEEERIVGTKLIADVSFRYEADGAAETDDLSQTVNYQEVYAVVQNVMNAPAQLLENVAYRIIRELKSRFPDISDVKVTVSKLNPVLGGKTAAATVSMKED